MTELDEINFEADNEDSESLGLNNLLYPIIGSVISALCIIGVAVFILSRRKCRKRTPKDTESEILKQKLNHDKQKIANSSLVYSMQSKPVYTSITQQEDNEIADEVRESYKEISPHVNKPIILCPNDKSHYSYFPKQNTEENVKKVHEISKNADNGEKHPNISLSGGKLFQENINKDNFLAPNDLDFNFENDSLLSHQSSFHESDSLTNRPPFDHLDDNAIETKDKVTLQNQQSLLISFEGAGMSSRKEAIVSRWMSQDEHQNNMDTNENRITKETQYVNNGPHIEHNSSLKTKLEANYEDVESILTSVSRMDKGRLEKLKETDFYKKLQYSDKPLNISVDSIDVESLDDSVNTPIFNQNKGSMSHEEIITFRSREDKSEDTSFRKEYDDKDDKIGVLAKKSLKKPLHYIDGDSESFFKTVRASLNPDNFSESGRTFSEDFKKSRRDSKASGILESSLSVNTYSYDKESHYVIIDEKRETKEEDGRTYYSSSNSTSTSPSRPSTLALENKNTSINMSKDVCMMYDGDEYDDEQFSRDDLSPSSSTTDSTNATSNISRSTRRSQTSHSSNYTHSTLGKSALNLGTNIRINRSNNSFTDTTNEMVSDSDTTNSDSTLWTRQEQTTERTNHKTPTKYKSVRGNLSTYISSRQSATSAKTTNKGLNNDINKSARHSTPRKVRQSPGRRIFQSNRGINNQAKWKPQNSSNGTL